MIKLKMAWLLCKYHARAALLHSSRAVLPFLILLLSISIVLLIILPNVGARLRDSAFLSSLPWQVEISGKVVHTSKETPPKLDLAIPGATVHCGGRKTVSDASGAYRLRFQADHLDRIPIVVEYAGKSKTVYASFTSRKLRETLDIGWD